MRLRPLFLAAALSCTALSQSFTETSTTCTTSCITFPPAQPTDRPQNAPLEPFRLKLSTKDKRLPKHPPTYITCHGGDPTTNGTRASRFTFYPSHGYGNGLLWCFGDQSYPVAFNLGFGPQRTGFGLDMFWYKGTAGSWYVEGKNKKRYLEFVADRWNWEAHWVLASRPRADGTFVKKLNALWWVYGTDPSEETDIPVQLILDFPEGTGT